MGILRSPVHGAAFIASSMHSARAFTPGAPKFPHATVNPIPKAAGFAGTEVGGSPRARLASVTPRVPSTTMVATDSEELLLLQSLRGMSEPALRAERKVIWTLQKARDDLLLTPDFKMWSERAAVHNDLMVAMKMAGVNQSVLSGKPLTAAQFIMVCAQIQFLDEKVMDGLVAKWEVAYQSDENIDEYTNAIAELLKKFYEQMEDGKYPDYVRVQDAALDILPNLLELQQAVDKVALDGGSMEQLMMNMDFSFQLNAANSLRYYLQNSKGLKEEDWEAVVRAIFDGTESSGSLHTQLTNIPGFNSKPVATRKQVEFLAEQALLRSIAVNPNLNVEAILKNGLTGYPDGESMIETVQTAQAEFAAPDGSDWPTKAKNLLLTMYSTYNQNC